MHASGTLFTVQGQTRGRLMKHLLRTLFALIVLGGHTQAQQQAAQRPLTRMLFVFDASNSMNAFWGTKTRLEVAKELMLRSLDQLESVEDLELALRVYGNRTPIAPGRQDCDDTHLEVPFSTHSAPAMRGLIKSLRAVGTTPIARSLERAAKDFPETVTGRRGERPVRNVIVLITDGIEACDEDPCAVSRALQAKGIVLKPFVIGVGLEEAEKYSLRCIGNFFDADTPELFEQVLRIVIAQALNTTTAQIDLLTTTGRPTETDVPVTLFDQKTGEEVAHFVHTLNDHGLPDTLAIDPVRTYRVVAHTLPPSVREHVTVKPGQHTIITVDAGTGQLRFQFGGGPADAYPASAIVRRAGETATLHVQATGSTQRYRTGSYDLEVLTLPRTLITGVRIEQDRVTDISLPRNGVLNVQPSTPGPGSLFVLREGRLEWLADLDPMAPSMQFRLQPGRYRVTYRSRNARRTELSQHKEITIESGRTTNLTF